MELNLSTEGLASAHGYENSPGQHSADVELAHVDVNVYDTPQQGDTDEHAYSVASKVQASSEVTLSRRSAIILVVSGVILSAVISIISGVVVYHVTNGKTTQTDPETVHQRHNSSHDNSVNSDGRLEEINIILQAVQTTISAVEEKQNASDKQLTTLNNTILTVQEAQNISDKQLITINNTILTVQEAQNTSDVVSTEHRATNDRQLEAINNLVQEIQGKQNSAAEQVAFLAHSPTGTLVGSSPTFYTILMNIGGGYNETSGQFHAPVAGLYLFSMTLMASVSRPGITEVYCKIYKNSTLVALPSTFQGQWESSSTSAFIQLSVGDIVKLDCGGWNFIFTGTYTSFTGALIRVD